MEIPAATAMGRGLLLSRRSRLAQDGCRRQRGGRPRWSGAAVKGDRDACKELGTPRPLFHERGVEGRTDPEASRSAKRTLDSRVATPRCGRGWCPPQAVGSGAGAGVRRDLPADAPAGTIPAQRRATPCHPRASTGADPRKRPDRSAGCQAAFAPPCAGPMARNSSSQARLTSRRAERPLTARAVSSSAANVMPGLRKRSASSRERSRSYGIMTASWG